MKKVGLIIGKFCPLHKGHQFLIESAIETTNLLFIVIFDSPKFSIPIDVRVNWIQTLYPQVKIIQVEDIANDDRHAWIYYEKIFRKNIKEKVTHIFSSESYGEHLAKRYRAKNIIVDEQRSKIPVSGTIIRANPEKYKNYLDPLVYQYFIKNIK